VIFYQEPTSTLYCGHALTELVALPSESVDCIMTSPPYWGLRTYKTEPQIWGENHCEHDFSLSAPPRRQRKESDIVNLDSKQATVGGSNYDANGGQFCPKCNAWRGELGLEPTIELYISHLILIFNEVKRVLKKTGTCWVNIDDSYNSGTAFNHGCPGSKSAYGEWDGYWAKHRQIASTVPAKSLCLIPSRFVLAMVEHGWILRNDIVWYKPNPMPESVKDRFTTSWEHLFFFVKSKRYWFEQQFEPITEATIIRNLYPHSGGGPYQINRPREPGEFGDTELGRNKRDIWEINTQPCPFPGVHFATFPEKLCETPILAGCPQDGVVLDPFAGSGATGAVAKRLGRKYIGIELSEAYCKLHVKRLQEIPLAMELR
jgi:DNA modification methylase